jgi:hypothetical protein
VADGRLRLRHQAAFSKRKATIDVSHVYLSWIKLAWTIKEVPMGSSCNSAEQCAFRGSVLSLHEARSYPQTGGYSWAAGPFALLMALLLALVSSLAQAAGNESTHEGSQENAVEKNVIALFAGVTFKGHREDEPALGIEYERRLSESFGIGGILEYTDGEHDFWVYAVPVAYHNGPWKLYVAPGIEEKDDKSEPLLRLGVEYGFEVGDWEISPQFDVDFVNGEQVIILGVTFGWGF